MAATFNFQLMDIIQVDYERAVKRLEFAKAAYHAACSDSVTSKEFKVTQNFMYHCEEDVRGALALVVKYLKTDGS